MMRNNIIRRRFVTGAASIIASTTSSLIANCHAEATCPRLPMLTGGDLLWPKNKDGYIPYGAGATATDEKTEWEREKQQYIGYLARSGLRKERDASLVSFLNQLTFEDFHSQYTEGNAPGAQFRPYGGGLGVGHVAIVEKDATNGLNVIEAMPEIGVRRIQLRDWLKQRDGQLVFHGRVIHGTDQDRSKIAEVAAGYLKRPYSLWSFDLADETTFYCSKLAWLATLKALRISLDGNDKPFRTFWLSPKQLMTSRHVRVLCAPGTY